MSIELPVIELLTETEVQALPPPEWLVEDVVVAGSLVELIGAPGTGKSFLALDMAMAVASGQSWLGKWPSQQGDVVYIAAEGRGGTGKRLRAWHMHYNDPQGRPCVFVLQALPLMRAEMIQELIRAIKHLGLKPVLIIIDTMSRSLPGAMESESHDVSRFVFNCDVLRESLGTVVLVVHHTPKHSSGTGRGSGALDGAVDTIIEVQAKGGKIEQPYRRMTCPKQKDSEAFKELFLRITEVPSTDSCIMCIVDKAEYEGRTGAANGSDTNAHSVDKALEVLTALGPEGVPSHAWQERFMESTGKCAKTWSRARSVLRSERLIRESRGIVWVR